MIIIITACSITCKLTHSRYSIHIQHHPTELSSSEPSERPTDESSSGGSSSGAIAGTVIGTLVAVLLIAALVVLVIVLMRKRRLGKLVLLFHGKSKQDCSANNSGNL